MKYTKNAVLKSAILVSVSTTCVAQTIEEVEVKSPYIAASRLPVTYTNLDAGDIARQPSLSEPSFLLALTPSVTVYSDAGSYQGYSYIRLRGIDQTRINMTLDGVPLNEPEDQGVYFSNYPGIFNALGGVQVQRGVGLSQNGVSSFGGSIALVSDKYSRLSESTLELGYGSFSTKSVVGQYASDGDSQKRVKVIASGVTTDGYKYSSGNRSYSLFATGDLEDANGAWHGFAFTGGQKNDLSWLGVSAEDIATDRRSNGNSEVENDQFSQTLVSVAREQQITNKLSAVVRGYYGILDGNYDFDLNNFVGVAAEGPIYNYALDSDLAGLFATFTYIDDGIALTSGLHLDSYSRTHTGTESTMGSWLYENTGYKDSFSAFVRGELSLDKLTLFGDLQYRHASFDYSGDVGFSMINWEFFNPRAGFSYGINDALDIYYSVGKSGREPTRTDMFGGNDNLLSDAMGNPEIFVTDAEFVVDQEAGFRVRFDGHALKINFYQMVFDNELTLNGGFGPNGLQLNRDVEKSFRRGVEMDSTIQLSTNVSATVAASYNRSEIEDQGQSFEPILTPRWLWHSAVAYSSDDLDASISLRCVSESYVDLGNEHSIGNQLYLDAYMAYIYGASVWKISINNIFNRNQNSSGALNIYGAPTYFVSPPRNIFLSAQWKL